MYIYSYYNLFINGWYWMSKICQDDNFKALTILSILQSSISICGNLGWQACKNRVWKTLVDALAALVMEICCVTTKGYVLLGKTNYKNMYLSPHSNSYKENFGWYTGCFGYGNMYLSPQKVMFCWAKQVIKICICHHTWILALTFAICWYQFGIIIHNINLILNKRRCNIFTVHQVFYMSMFSCHSF